MQRTSTVALGGSPRLGAARTLEIHALGSAVAESDSSDLELLMWDGSAWRHYPSRELGTDISRLNFDAASPY